MMASRPRGASDNDTRCRPGSFEKETRCANTPGQRWPVPRREPSRDPLPAFEAEEQSGREQWPWLPGREIELAIAPGRDARSFRVAVVRSPAGEVRAEAALDVEALLARRAQPEQAVSCVIAAEPCDLAADRASAA